MNFLISNPAAVLLILVAALNWVAAAILLHASHLHPRGVALRERSRAAVILALAVTLAVPLLFNVQSDFPWLDRETLVLAGYIVTIIAGLPAIVWLVMYLRDAWDE